MAIPVESFIIERSGDTTLQQELQRQVVRGIVSGRFLPGDRMPSSRKLAEHLGISRITVTIAYTELVSDDYLVAHGRSGYFVSRTAPAGPLFDLPTRSVEGQFDWSRVLGQHYSGFRDLVRPPDWRKCPYPFIYGQADPQLFDHQNWRLCALQALGQRDFETLSEDHYERDDPLLVEYILQNILPRRGIAARPENILLTLGAQNALWMSAQLVLTQRRTAAMENPCYPSLREILHQARCRTIAIDVDANGLPPDKLPDDVDAVFVTASHHCPTNVTMPIERRRRLLELSAERGFVIVEDDYEFEISFKGTHAPALKALDDSGAVIHIGSFSKSLFPGLRLGFMVASERVIEEARALRALVLRHPPGVIQRATAYFLSLGHYDTQVNRMRNALQKRRAIMETAIGEHGLTPATERGSGGSSFWMRARGIDTSELATRLYQRGVLIEPGAAFFAGSSGPSDFYRLAYSSINASRIADGIAIIAEDIATSGPTA